MSLCRRRFGLALDFFCEADSTTDMELEREADAGRRPGLVGFSRS